MGSGPPPAVPGPVTLENWLDNTDTGNILTDFAVAEVLLSRTIGQSLNLMKASLLDMNQRIKTINGLIEQLREDRPRFKTDNTTVADPNTEGGLCDNSFESQMIIDKLKSFGVEIKDTDVKKDVSPWLVKQATFTVWIESRQGKSDTTQSDSQQEQTVIQQTLGRMTQALDAGSSLTRKHGELKDNIATGLRGGG